MLLPVTQISITLTIFSSHIKGTYQFIHLVSWILCLSNFSQESSVCIISNVYLYYHFPFRLRQLMVFVQFPGALSVSHPIPHSVHLFSHTSLILKHFIYNFIQSWCLSVLQISSCSCHQGTVLDR